MPCTPILVTRACVTPAPASALSTASPRPPSGQWSSTVISRPPHSRAAATSVSTSTGLTEYRSMTRACTPSCSRRSAAVSASCTVTPAPTMARRSSGEERTTFAPPSGNFSSGP